MVPYGLLTEAECDIHCLSKDYEEVYIETYDYDTDEDQPE